MLGFADELANFFLVNQELAGAQGGMIGVIAMVVGADVAVEEPEFAVFDQAVGVLKIGLARADGFDLGSGERDSGLEFFQQK